MKEIAESGEAVVTDLDLINATRMFGPNQTVLYILQQKGAPIQGNLYFEVMDGYDWSMSMNPITYDRVFTWRKRHDSAVP